VFLCRRYVCCTVVSARVYRRCHGVKVTMDSVRRVMIKVKCKTISVTSRGIPQAYETSRLPHFLDNRLKDGGDVSPIYPHEDSWYSFVLEAVSTPGT
jgi:hypothetical protein